ncbi:MAG TPA: hypothetical protein VM870_01000, partial [Pyrinomonadaceae bacterium]|nr:hypothetical protein [Pyrinomonadaceae bacterium]
MSGNEARVNEDRERRTVISSSSAAAQVREQLAALRGSRQHALLRWPELVGLGASALMVLAVLFAYFYFLLPANLRLARLRSEREELQRKINAFEAGAKQKDDAQATATEIGESLRDFEAAHLPPRSAARTEILQELTGLIAANKLQQASAMTITANDAGAVADFNSNRPRRANDEKDQVIFPSTDISFSVEGPYA